MNQYIDVMKQILYVEILKWNKWYVSSSKFNLW